MRIIKLKKTDWQVFWEEYRNQEPTKEKDLFFQVGKTINKEIIPTEIFNDMISDIKLKLNLSTNDILLEMCCGNGLLSKPLGGFVKQVYAFDFTERLIETAKKFMYSSNIEYKVGDVREDINNIFLFKEKPNKILMNDSLGYFETFELSKIIENMMDRRFYFYITGIPSDTLKWNFYNTYERKKRYAELRKIGDDHNDGIGRWWTYNDFMKIAKIYNLEVIIENQPKKISTYRMNVLLKNQL